MRTDAQRNTDPKNAVRGPEVQTNEKNDESTEGNYQRVVSQLVQHNSKPLTPVFGLLSSEIVNNELNRHSTRRVDTTVDTSDLHELISWNYNGLSDLGDDIDLTYTSLFDIENINKTSLEAGHLILSDTIAEFDRVHGKRTTVKVCSWEPRTTILKGDPDAGGNDIQVVEQVVRETATWPVVDSNTMGLRREQIGVDKFKQTVTKAPNGFGTITVLDDFGFRGCRTRKTEKKVNNNFALPAKSTNDIELSLQQIDGFKSLYTKIELVDGWPTFISTEEEATTGKKVTVTRTIHDVAPIVPADATARFVTSVNNTGCDRWTKVVREIDASILTDTFTEWHTIEYDFPKYLDEDDPFRVYNGTQVSYENPVLSSAYRLKVLSRFEVTYHTTQPTAPDTFQFKTVDINIFGYRFLSGNDVLTINISNVLTDGFTVNAYLPINTTSNIAVAFSVPASSPTTSEYKSYMTAGSEALIIWDVTKWKYNLWRQVKVFMPFPNLEGAAGGVIS